MLGYIIFATRIRTGTAVFFADVCIVSPAATAVLTYLFCRYRVAGEYSPAIRSPAGMLEGVSHRRELKDDQRGSRKSLLKVAQSLACLQADHSRSRPAAVQSTCVRFILLCRQELFDKQQILLNGCRGVVDKESCEGCGFASSGWSTQDCGICSYQHSLQSQTAHTSVCYMQSMSAVTAASSLSLEVGPKVTSNSLGTRLPNNIGSQQLRVTAVLLMWAMGINDQSMHLSGMLT